MNHIVVSRRQVTRLCLAILTLFAVFGGAACEGDRGATALRGAQTLGRASASAAPYAPAFLRQAPDAPPLQTSQVSFVAVAGQAQTVEILYERAAGQSVPDSFLRFELGAGSLLRHPNGQAFQPGDQVTITIEVESEPAFGGSALIAKLSPEDLEFDPAAPAELALSFTHADPDTDGDGLPDLNRNRVKLWRQATSGARWEVVAGAPSLSGDAIEAQLRSFSRYALAI